MKHNLCGPSSAKCRCECGRDDGTGDRLQKPLCEHVWDGPGQEAVYLDGGSSSSVTCSRCGMSALSHDMWVMP